MFSSPPRSHGSLQTGDLLVHSARGVAQGQKYQEDDFGLARARTLVLVLLDLGEDLGLVDLPVES